VRGLYVEVVAVTRFRGVRVLLGFGRIEGVNIIHQLRASNGWEGRSSARSLFELCERRLVSRSTHGFANRYAAVRVRVTSRGGPGPGATRKTASAGRADGFITGYCTAQLAEVSELFTRMDLGLDYTRI